MPIHYQHVITVATTAERAFVMIDDLPTFAKWLPWPCVSLAKVGDRPNTPGDTLLYVITQGGRLTAMYGVILDRIPGHRLHCTYNDRSFEVRVDLRVAGRERGDYYPRHHDLPDDPHGYAHVAADSLRSGQTDLRRRGESEEVAGDRGDIVASEPAEPSAAPDQLALTDSRDLSRTDALTVDELFRSVTFKFLLHAKDR